MTTKPLVIYHADCTDGYAAAFAAWLKFRDEAEYLPMQYGSNLDAEAVVKTRGMISDREIYILDFSLPRQTMNWMFATAKRVVWLDHHKSAFEMWCGQSLERYGPALPEMGFNHYILLDNNKSGCILAWEYFHPNTEVPMLLQHIDDRDRWQWKMEGSAEIHAALASHQPWTFDKWDCLVGAIEEPGAGYENPLEELMFEGSAILRAQRQHIEQMLKQARKCMVSHEQDIGVFGDEHKDLGPVLLPGLACNSQLHASELGHELAVKSGTFGLIWYLSGDNRVKCSFRSDGDYDVSAIAKVFGGGGHKNAAGCEVSVETLLGWLK